MVGGRGWAMVEGGGRGEGSQRTTRAQRGYQAQQKNLSF